jgi:predicted MPP superfamily phosphohydrolase
MRLAVLGDAHLIAADDPYKDLHQRRGFFKSAWPSFRALLKEVNQRSPDQVVFLGDLVDWFSPENIAFGLDLLSQLQCPWHMVAGNHDLAAPSHGHDQKTYATTATRDHMDYWLRQGVDLGNHAIDTPGGTAILLDNALSDLAETTEPWLTDLLRRSEPSLLFAHVPIDTPPTRDYILSVDPRRSMAKYVLSSSPDFYPRFVENRLAHVFSAHLHFPGDLHLGCTRFHLCTMSITMDDPNRSQSTRATATLVDFKGDAVVFEKISAG